MSLPTSTAAAESQNGAAVSTSGTVRSVPPAAATIALHFTAENRVPSHQQRLGRRVRSQAAAARIGAVTGRGVGVQQLVTAHTATLPLERTRGGRPRATRMWTSRMLRQGRIKRMYLLLAAHADGAALQELTSLGAPHPANPEPRVVSTAELAGVVLRLEKRRPRWIWHRTQDWYPSLLAAGVELERCYDLSLCGAILAHSEFTAGTEYANNAEKLTQDDDLQQPHGRFSRLLRLLNRAPCSTIGAAAGGPAEPGGAARRVRRPAGQPSARRPSRRGTRRTTAGSGCSCSSRPSPPPP